MEKYLLGNNITVFCITAMSFPEGISEAHQTLRDLLPSDDGRKFFGISSPNRKGEIVYKAAVEELFDGEAEKFGCEKFVIKNGEYISIMVHDFQINSSEIVSAFHELLTDPKIDSQGECVEMYPGQNDVRCMVRLASEKIPFAETTSSIKKHIKKLNS